MIFETLDTYGHEQVVFCHNKDAGLKAIIAIHNTVLGPALGGTRMWPYKSEQEALNDVLRLSRGMTYKNAVAGLNIGGGKAVIIGNPATDKSEALFRAGINPKKAARRLTARECERLAKSIKDTLRAAIKAGGSSIQNFLAFTFTGGPLPAGRWLVTQPIEVGGV